MQRREMLAAGSAALLGLSTFPCGLFAAAPRNRQKLLYFTRSVEYEHSVVRADADGSSHSERILRQLGEQAGFAVESTKDGRVFDGDLDRYDALIFYSCGNMFRPSVQGTPPMSADGHAAIGQCSGSGQAVGRPPFLLLLGR